MPQFRMVPVEEVFTWDSIDFYGDIDTWPRLIESKREDDEYEYLVESITMHGFRSFVCVNTRGDIPAVHNGHHRIAALMALGHNHIPCVFFDDDDDDAWSYGEDVFLPIEVDKSSPDEVVNAIGSIDPIW